MKLQSINQNYLLTQQDKLLKEYFDQKFDLVMVNNDVQFYKLNNKIEVFFEHTISKLTNIFNGCFYIYRRLLSKNTITDVITERNKHFENYCKIQKNKKVLTPSHPIYDEDNIISYIAKYNLTDFENYIKTYEPKTQKGTILSLQYFTQFLQSKGILERIGSNPLPLESEIGYMKYFVHIEYKNGLFVTKPSKLYFTELCISRLKNLLIKSEYFVK